MPSINLYPTAAGFHTAWVNGAGSIPTNVQTNDGHTSYVKLAGADSGKETYQVDDMPGDAVSVTSVTAHAVLIRQGAGGGNLKHIVRYNGVDLLSSNFSITAAWVDYSWLVPTAPGGGGWTPTIVNATEFGQQRYNGADEVRCTQCYAVVVYVAGGETFITFYQYLLPLLGTALSYAQFRAAAMIAAAARAMRFDEGEVERLWRVHMAWRHPHSLNMAVAG